MATSGSIYDIVTEGLDGKAIDFDAFKGKKLLIVNTASECGFTPQYAQLQELYDMYKDQLTVLGVPCNDFGAQEPGSAEEIASFCQKNYGVTFPLTAKQHVVGELQSPLYQYLTGLPGADAPQWNFHKYLFDEEGNLLGSYPSNIDPLSEEILGALGVAQD